MNYCPNHYVWPIHNYNNETIVKHGQISELALSAYIILTRIASCKESFEESFKKLIVSRLPFLNVHQK